jgi:subtilisin family serine protease
LTVTFLGSTQSPYHSSNSAFLFLLSQGTHVAGTILAIEDNEEGVLGVNRNGQIGIRIVRLFDDTGYAWASDFVELVNDCAVNGANVVSMRCGKKVLATILTLYLCLTVFLNFTFTCLSIVLGAQRGVR